MKPHVHRWRHANQGHYRRCDCGRWGLWVGLGSGSDPLSGVDVYNAGGAKEQKLERRYQARKEPDAVSQGVPRCQAAVYKRDTYRRVGGKQHFALYYTREQCSRAAKVGDLCQQHAAWPNCGRAGYHATLRPKEPTP